MREVSRHEDKYLIGAATAALLKARFRAVLRTDPHAGRDGSYFIRSLYFDDAAHTAYREKLSGVRERTKYRLRFYDLDDRLVFLEKKMKSGDLTGKRSARLTRQEALCLCQGGDLAWAERDPLLAEFALARRGTYRPAVLVDYDRFAYLYPVENVRVTLDMDVRTCPYETALFARGLPTAPVLEPGTAVLEVKYNAFLPSHVAWLLEGFPKQRLAVSKFVKCMSVLE